jgi:hypothetical protein
VFAVSIELDRKPCFLSHKMSPWNNSWQTEEAQNVFDDGRKLFDGEMQHEAYKDRGFYGFVRVDIGLAKKMFVRWAASGHKISYAPAHRKCVFASVRRSLSGMPESGSDYCLFPRRGGAALFLPRSVGACTADLHGTNPF